MNPVDIVKGDAATVPDMPSEVARQLDEDTFRPENQSSYDEGSKIEAEENAGYHDAEVDSEKFHPYIEAELLAAEKSIQEKIAKDPSGEFAREYEQIENSYKKEMNSIEGAKALAKCMAEAVV